MRDRQHKQKIDTEKAAEGIIAANENAKSLLEDAKLLFKYKRYARAISLAILSIEESGKSSIIHSILLEDEPKEIAKKWKEYRNHHDKNSLWILPELASNGAKKIEDFRRIVDIESDHRQTLDNLKQLCFYTDAFSKCKWSYPDKVANENVAKSILQIAEISVDKKAVFSTKEMLDIWVKHMKEVWEEKKMSSMKIAMINCYQECEDLGYLEKGKTKEITNFLL